MINEQNTKNLYNSPDVANKIREYAKLKGISLKDLLLECNLGSNTFSRMNHGKFISFDKLAKIADCLDCPVDYLLGRTNDVNGYNNNRITNSDNVAFGAGAHIEIHKGTDNMNDEVMEELQKILNELTLEEKADFIKTMYQFKKK